MPDFAKMLGASRGASTLLVLFIPSKDRSGEAIDQQYWVDEALSALGTLFGGTTAFPQGRGVWRDDAQGGQLLFDEPVVVQCYTNEQAIEGRAAELKAFLHRMGREAKQGRRQLETIKRAVAMQRDRALCMRRACGSQCQRKCQWQR